MCRPSNHRCALRYESGGAKSEKNGDKVGTLGCLISSAFHVHRLLRALPIEVIDNAHGGLLADQDIAVGQWIDRRIGVEVRSFVDLGTVGCMYAEMPVNGDIRRHTDDASGTYVVVVAGACNAWQECHHASSCFHIRGYPSTMRTADDVCSCELIDTARDVLACGGISDGAVITEVWACVRDGDAVASEGLELLMK